MSDTPRSIAAGWSRRQWLALTATQLAAIPVASALSVSPASRCTTSSSRATSLVPDLASERIDADSWESLAQHAIDAAKSAGAQYADAHLSRTVLEQYLGYDKQVAERTRVGAGVRVMVNGCWGFAARQTVNVDDIARLARTAVAQARANATATPRSVDMGAVPAARGRWSTPVRIDPFTVSIEEKIDFFEGWLRISNTLRNGVHIVELPSGFDFARQERVLATTDGSLVTQTLYESAGFIRLSGPAKDPSEGMFGGPGSDRINGLTRSALGWEMMLDANVPEQLHTRGSEILERQRLYAAAKPFQLGRTTIVCTGGTMASMLERTLGAATQIDRALGYEANAGGTSFVTDPLGMVGQLQVAAQTITMTADRSAATRLGTVRWDEEGVEPQPFTLIKDGILHDFQTTREQAAWLAPYYQKMGMPVRSHGCAASEDALAITMQHMPNLTLAPAPNPVSIDDLIANVTNGLLVTDATAYGDSQQRSGKLGYDESLKPRATMELRKITNGRLGAILQGGEFLFNTTEFWKNITGLGGESTLQTIPSSQFPERSIWDLIPNINIKGQPSQITSHSVTAPAAIIPNQAIIDVRRRS